jgi:hypothetical protein
LIRLQHTAWLRTQPSGSVKWFIKAILQYFWLQVGLADSDEFQIVNNRQLASYKYSCFKILHLVGKGQNSVGKLIEFCEAYFWKDLTILFLDVQKDWKVFSEAFVTFAKTETGLISTYTDVVL